jgi:hypothetical protein
MEASNLHFLLLAISFQLLAIFGNDAKSGAF